MNQWLARTDSEIETLTASARDLQAAKEKFKESLEVVEVSSKLPEKDILVPLTGSMYVPGKMYGNKYLIDIGTSYLVKKDSHGAKDYFERKIKFLDLQLNIFQDLIKKRHEAKQEATQK